MERERERRGKIHGMMAQEIIMKERAIKQI
jgi:hypothetical protein